MATETSAYAAQAQVYLGQAQAELERGVLRQASEKGWGAASQIVKAVADQRGWEHTSHRAILLALRRIADEAEDDELDRSFDAARALHGNFYEGDLSQRDVRTRLEFVKTLVARLGEQLA